jgi:hypothetical protein
LAKFKIKTELKQSRKMIENPYRRGVIQLGSLKL